MADKKKSPQEAAVGAGLRDIVKNAGGKAPAGSGLKALLAERTKEQIEERLRNEAAAKAEEDNKKEGDDQDNDGDDTADDTAVYTEELVGIDAYDEYIDANFEPAGRYIEILELVLSLLDDFIYGEESIAYRYGFDEENLKNVFRAIGTRVLGGDLVTDEEMRGMLDDSRFCDELVREEFFGLSDDTPSHVVAKRIPLIIPAMQVFKDLLGIKDFRLLAEAIKTRYENEDLTYDQIRKKPKLSTLPATRTELLLDEKMIEKVFAETADKGVISSKLRNAITSPRQGRRGAQGVEFRQPAVQTQAPLTAPMATPEAADIDPLEIRAMSELKDTIIVLDTLEAVFKAPQDQFEADLRVKFDGADRLAIMNYLNELNQKKNFGGNLWGISYDNRTILELIVETFKPKSLSELTVTAKEISAAIRDKYPNIHTSPEQDMQDWFESITS